jgi:glycopeptide antibiotics resistance protein
MGDLRSVAGAAPPVLTRHHYGLLALGLALFVVYGSLVPFRYQPLPWAEGLARFGEVCRQPVQIESRSDWLANVLLVVPLGFFLMGVLCVDRRRVGLLAAPVVLPCCLALSAAVEFAQVWFPPRVSSLDDIVAQGVGEVLGVAAWLAAGQRLTGWARRLWAAVGTRGLAAQLLPGYLALLGLIHGMPFDLTLSPKDFRRKYRHGAIRLVPFTGYDRDVLHAVEKGLWNVALFLPLGLLLAHVSGPAWQSRRGWWRVLAVGVAASLLIQGLKLFVVSRYVDVSDVITGSLAVLAGWGLARAVQRRHQASALPGRLPDADEAGRRARRLVGLLLAAWLAVAVFVNWQPFDFTPDAGLVGGQLRQVSLVPFADYYWGNYWDGFDQFVHKMVLFVPLGVLLTVALPAARGRGALVVGLAALVAAVIEAGQLFLPTRYASVTDVLIASGGAWVGLLVTRQARLLMGLAAARQAAYSVQSLPRGPHTIQADSTRNPL